jgi:hypothetical protein
MWYTISVQEKTMKKYCRIRKDLVDVWNKVPIGHNVYISGNKKREYKWVGDCKFFIKYKNEWCEAYSIDFDF